MSKNLIAQFDYVNETEGYRVGTDGPLGTRFYTKGELFAFCQSEYGRCVSKVYVDDKQGSAKQIGWCFEKLVKYEDCNERYLQVVWVTVHNSMPVKSITYDYAQF